ncbi:hypothetical protein COV16_00625 [Candidatus Woesearchaeota archaeon CG10_big_fil_rev_8_21_14_0_10_34_8]|nr:MAG: hypothetical protein COV16_00625 [Candidatus Woesearchaeota archaeon CG10_big_fil_rev_8_21_14_0_10_34_8]
MQEKFLSQETQLNTKIGLVNKLLLTGTLLAGLFGCGDNPYDSGDNLETNKRPVALTEVEDNRVFNSLKSALAEIKLKDSRIHDTPTILTPYKTHTGSDPNIDLMTIVDMDNDGLPDIVIKTRERVRDVDDWRNLGYTPIYVLLNKGNGRYVSQQPQTENGTLPDKFDKK